MQTSSFLSIRGGAKHSLVDFSWTPHVFETAADVINFTGGTVLLVASALAIFNTLLHTYTKVVGHGKAQSLDTIRLHLGSWVTFSLELLVAADVIDTLTKPAHMYKMESLYKIGLVVIIRTTLAYFLGKELEEIEKRVHAKAKATSLH